MCVFVLDQNLKPLDPCHPARVRELLKKRRAAVFRRYPFTIVLQRTVEESITSSHQLKIDPGYALLNIDNKQQQQQEAFALLCKDMLVQHKFFYNKLSVFYHNQNTGLREPGTIAKEKACCYGHNYPYTLGSCYALLSGFQDA